MAYRTIVILQSLAFAVLCYLCIGRRYYGPAQAKHVDPSKLPSQQSANLLVLSPPKKGRLYDLKKHLKQNMNLVEKTMMAFDFDMTLREESTVAVGKSMLRKDQGIPELFRWFQKKEIPVIIVTARTPGPGEWLRTVEQAQQLEILEYVGRPSAIRNLQRTVSKKKPRSSAVKMIEEGGPCLKPKEGEKESDLTQEVIEYRAKFKECRVFHVDGSAYYVGKGIIISGHKKGQTIVDYIRLYDLQPRQVVFVDDYASNVYDVSQVLQQRAPDVTNTLGVWLEPSDKADIKFGSTIFHQIEAKTQRLEACLQTEVYSKCESEGLLIGSWCDSRISSAVGDNSFNPKRSDNMRSVYFLKRVGHLPTNTKEQEMEASIMQQGYMASERIHDQIKRCDSKQKEEKMAKPKEKACCEFSECNRMKLKFQIGGNLQVPPTCFACDPEIEAEVKARIEQAEASQTSPEFPSVEDSTCCKEEFEDDPELRKRSCGIPKEKKPDAVPAPPSKPAESTSTGASKGKGAGKGKSLAPPAFKGKGKGKGKGKDKGKKDSGEDAGESLSAPEVI
eukprot:TRINITY_DN16040_c1_g1_i1.p1 TRINITY_DN16040_c1_g1~~TRINITY_DN16040_c1_g1_i1.p1  ORF type:complete len:560 (+),score=108.72 TRINITY_DN16040_c1_g1_i1:62-1741(+)